MLENVQYGDSTISHKAEVLPGTKLKDPKVKRRNKNPPI
jgi:hypothetical protein